MSSLNLGIVGNCSIAGLIDQKGRVVWCCMPRLDGDPVFCSLVDGGEKSKDSGYYEIEIENFSHSEQRYLTNSAILETILYDQNNNAIRLIDFCPRYEHHGRVHRPPHFSPSRYSP